MPVETELTQRISVRLERAFIKINKLVPDACWNFPLPWDGGVPMLLYSDFRGISPLGNRRQLTTAVQTVRRMQLKYRMWKPRGKLVCTNQLTYYHHRFYPTWFNPGSSLFSRRYVLLSRELWGLLSIESLTLHALLRDGVSAT